MKRLRLVLIMLLSLSLTGCIQEYSVSEQQDDAAAEYMAGLLLKYDEDYEQGLTPLEQIKEESETATLETPTPTAIPKEDTTPGTSEDQAEVQKEYTLSEVIGEKDFDIIYTGYKITDTYPEDAESAYFSLTPRMGNQLLVTSFALKNITDSKKTLQLSKTKIQYQLDVNIGTVYKPLLTLLENDLQYLDITIEGGDKKTVLLIFEIAKDTDISEINLIVSKEEKTEIVEIK